MCNLYSLTKGQAAIRDWFRAKHDRTGNLPLFPGIFPDQFAPIVRSGADGEREFERRLAYSEIRGSLKKRLC
jgi:putative SOS response-associated peptidase YedK